MSGAECRNKGILYIEKALEEFDRVILIDSKLGDQQLVDAFYDEDNFKGTDKRILILSEAEDKQAGNIEWRHIAEKEAGDILEIYYLYEFSNRIVIVAQDQIFGSLVNYVDTGLLTREEMVAAVLR